jgi:iron complex transport system ATP-binding protein
VADGVICCVAGPNGCGKSTLLKTIARLLFYSGVIKFNDDDIARLNRKQLARVFAFLPQTRDVYFPYSVYETIALGRYAYRNAFASSLSKTDTACIESVMEKLELSCIRGANIDELSGGQLQRVLLARTLVQEPKVILLDEPTNHLDIKYQLELLDFLQDWVADKENSRAVVAVMHDLNLIKNYAHQTALLLDGKIFSQGATDTVLSQENLRSVYGVDIKSFNLRILQKWQDEKPIA